jgi:hypothetical protein
MCGIVSYHGGQKFEMIVQKGRTGYSAQRVAARKPSIRLLVKSVGLRVVGAEPDAR